MFRTRKLLSTGVSVIVAGAVAVCGVSAVSSVVLPEQAMAAIPEMKTTTFTFDLNCGKSSVSLAPVFSKNGTFTIPAYSQYLSRDGYVFKGWNTEYDGNGAWYNFSNTAYSVADCINNINAYAEAAEYDWYEQGYRAAEGETITLYAIWQKRTTDTVTYFQNEDAYVGQSLSSASSNTVSKKLTYVNKTTSKFTALKMTNSSGQSVSYWTDVTTGTKYYPGKTYTITTHALYLIPTYPAAASSYDYDYDKDSDVKEDYDSHPQVVEYAELGYTKTDNDALLTRLDNGDYAIYSDGQKKWENKYIARGTSNYYIGQDGYVAAIRGADGKYYSTSGTVTTLFTS